VFAISFLIARHGGHGAGARATLQLFLVGFAVLVVVNSFGLLPSFVIGMANEASRWCLVAAIAALGMKTRSRLCSRSDGARSDSWSRKRFGSRPWFCLR
jgi:uncharacterized membrane protein YadS